MTPAAPRLRPSNPAEALVWHGLVWTWPLYFIGALYVAGPVLGWTLAGLAGLVLYLGPAIRPDLRATSPVPALAWGWCAGMLVLLATLWLGHLNWSLGLATTIKSTIGWAKGWALIALFILAGSVLPIRREILVRGQCIVGLWTTCLTPFLFAAPFLHLPERIFTSPLKAIGGPGPEYFSVYLFTYDPSNWAPRWQFYAPWSPFAALLGVIMVVFALEERDRRWRMAGLTGALAMILLSKSRMGMIGLVACTLIPRLLPLIAKSWAWHGMALASASLAVLGGPLMQAADEAVAAFRGARADSTRVREALQRIAGERWQAEAFWFGHGTVHPGGHVVEHMPIGSHHTWWGLLFVKGLAGMLALLVPMLWQIANSTAEAARGASGRLPLGLVLTIVLLSFGENLEIEAYMLWPALLLLGINLREQVQAGGNTPAGRHFPIMVS